jgi:hypothetical protein
MAGHVVLVHRIEVRVLGGEQKDWISKVKILSLNHERISDKIFQRAGIND